MKEKFLANKKKIIVGLLTVLALMFPPVRALIPAAELIIDSDQSANIEVTIK